MVSSPQQQPTSTYEGRRLPRPDEELVDQGLGFDVDTLLSRRRLLGLRHRGGHGRAGGLRIGQLQRLRRVVLVGTTASGEIPDETAGPYPGDGSNGPDVLEQSGIVRSDIRSSFGDASGTAEGVPMTLELTSPTSRTGGAVRGGGRLRVALRPRGPLLHVLPGRRGPELPARRAGRRRERPRHASPASSPPATAGAGRTSTSRCTPTWPASPTRRTRSRPRRSRCRRTPATPSTRRAATRPRSATSRGSASTATTSSATTAGSASWAQ